MGMKALMQMIRQGFLSVVSDDTSEFPTAQITSNNRASDVVRLSPYGLLSNPPADSHVLLFQSQCDESVKFGIFSDTVNRKRELKAGECALYNSLTGAIVYMKADGSIYIESSTSIDGKAPIINVEADTEINVTAPVINVTVPIVNVIASTEVNVTTPKAIIDSASVELGTGALEKLINKVGMDTYNVHTHVEHPNSTKITDPPAQQMVEGTDTTTNTEAS